MILIQGPLKTQLIWLASTTISPISLCYLGQLPITLTSLDFLAAPMLIIHNRLPFLDSVYHYRAGTPLTVRFRAAIDSSNIVSNRIPVLSLFVMRLSSANLSALSVCL